LVPVELEVEHLLATLLLVVQYLSSMLSGLKVAEVVVTVELPQTKMLEMATLVVLVVEAVETLLPEKHQMRHGFTCKEAEAVMELVLVPAIVPVAAVVQAVLVLLDLQAVPVVQH
jgi:hypothetical protein